MLILLNLFITQHQFYFIEELLNDLFIIVENVRVKHKSETLINKEHMVLSQIRNFFLKNIFGGIEGS